jgi:hypothetical protein
MLNYTNFILNHISVSTVGALYGAAMCNNGGYTTSYTSPDHQWTRPGAPRPHPKVTGTRRRVRATPPTRAVNSARRATSEIARAAILVLNADPSCALNARRASPGSQTTQLRTRTHRACAMADLRALQRCGGTVSQCWGLGAGAVIGRFGEFERALLTI